MIKKLREIKIAKNIIDPVDSSEGYLQYLTHSHTVTPFDAFGKQAF